MTMQETEQNPIKFEVNDLSFSYGKRPILKNITFEAEPGNLVAVLGRNGAGKSTLFRLLLGLKHAETGSILLNGKHLTSISAKALAAQIAYIPQANAAVFRFFVRDVILMGTTSAFGTFAMPSSIHEERANQAMQRLGLEAFADRPFNQLSGGEQQLVLIARALAQNTRCLVMDEPTASLDFGNQVRVMEIARQLARAGYLIFLSTHNPQHVLHYADRVLLLDHGHLRADGRPRDVLTVDVLSSIYDTPVELSRTRQGQTAVLPALEGPLRKDPWRAYNELVDPVGEEIVTDVILGSIWVAVETSSGFGVAMRQPWPEETGNHQAFIGKTLKEMAAEIFSFDLGRASLGLAAINCWYNRTERLDAKEWKHKPGMYATDGIDLKDKVFGMVGHLRHPDGYFNETKAFHIFEREPQPGDLPDTAEETMLPRLDACLITGSVVSNKSLPRVLELLSGAVSIMSGPSVPMAECLLDFGLDRIVGLVVTDVTGMKAHIRAGKPGPPFAFGQGFMINKDTIAHGKSENKEVKRCNDE